MYIYSFVTEGLESVVRVEVVTLIEGVVVFLDCDFLIKSGVEIFEKVGVV